MNTLFFLATLLLCEKIVASVICSSYTVYELEQDGDLKLSDVLMQEPLHESPGPRNESSPSCFNYTLYSGVYSLVGRISVYGESIVIKGVGGVVLQLEQESNNSGMGSRRAPGLLFMNNTYIEITDLDVDGSTGFLSFKNIESLVIKSSTFRYLKLQM